MSEISNQVSRAWKTVCEMLEDRSVEAGGPSGSAPSARNPSGESSIPAASSRDGPPDAKPRELKASVVSATGIGDVEIRALADEFPTFSLVTGPGTSVVFHTSQSTMKKGDVFHAAESSAAAAEDSSPATEAVAQTGAESGAESGSESGAQRSAQSSTAPAAAIKEQSARKSPHVILVLRNKNTATVKSLMAEAAARGARLDIFSVQELQYNPARHHLVPRHVRVPKGSEQDVLRMYRVTNRFQLPLILQGDVMARYLGLQHGDLVRVERPSPTAGKAVVYRACS
jgi:DNA-directed RNA polymerase subunit H (RpoH/RPB5)